MLLLKAERLPLERPNTLPRSRYCLDDTTYGTLVQVKRGRFYPQCSSTGFYAALDNRFAPCSFCFISLMLPTRRKRRGSGSLVGSARRAAPPRKDSMRTHKKLLLSCSPSSTLSSHSQKSERLFLKVGDYVSFLPNSSAHLFQASYDEVSCSILAYATFSHNSLPILLTVTALNVIGGMRKKKIAHSISSTIRRCCRTPLKPWQMRASSDQELIRKNAIITRSFVRIVSTLPSKTLTACFPIRYTLL